jgi:hypothetical protein
MNGRRMNRGKVKAAQLAGLVLVTGLTAGGMLAMATPTRPVEEGRNWREAIGLREVSAEDTAVPMFAPPEDLTPVHWQAAADEYALAATPDQGSDVSRDPSADDTSNYQPEPAIEALPSELLEGRGDDATVAAHADDAAGTSAQAARTAALEGRAQENGAAGSQADPPPSTPQPAADVS